MPATLKGIAPASRAQLPAVDPVWSRIREEAQAMIAAEPILAGLVLASILNEASLEAAVAHRLGSLLHADALPGPLIAQALMEALTADPSIAAAIRADIVAVADRDPACSRFIEPVLFFKGFHAIQTHRLAHWLWTGGRRDFALYLQSRSSACFQVDINPAARIGRGLFIDHATGVVIGSTCVIEDDVSIMQGVTLGGTGKEVGDRHPKIRHGVLIGAGATVLGNIEVGHCARIASGSVVLKPVPHNTTVAGVPAQVVGAAGCAEPARAMDQILAEKSDT